MTTGRIKGGAVGQALDRVDGRLKTTGAARYSAEYPFKNVAHVWLVHSRIAKGRIKSISTDEAEKSPGVLAVITHENAPEMKKPVSFDVANPAGGTSGSDVHLLHTDEIFWDGQPVAVVVAETLDAAQEAAALVRVEYEDEPPKSSLAEEKAEAFVPDNLVGEETEIKKGDAESALAAAPFKVDHVYTTPPHNHNPIEPHATTAVWEGDRLTIYDASQYISGAQGSLAKMFSMQPEDIRVVATFVGGGFGCKGQMWHHVPLAVAAAKVVERPVRLALSRESMFRIVGGRTPTEQRVALGAGQDGKLTALIQSGYSQTSTTNTFAEPFTSPARHLYAAENLLLKQKMARLDIVPNTMMRAPGESVGTFALESAMDELAYALRLDPVALRRRNEPDKDPTKDVPFSLRNLTEAYRLGAQAFGWSKREPEPRSMRDGKWLVGMGCATAFYPVFQFPATARVEIHRDGTAVVQSGTHEMGMGTATAQIQLAADALGLPFERVRFEYGDTNLPQAPVAGGSCTTVSVGAAVEAACEEARRQMLALVGEDFDSPLIGSQFDDVEFRDGRIFRKDESSKGETYADVLARFEMDKIEADGEAQAGDEQQKFSMSSYGAQFCEVRVDEETGEIRIARFVGAFDCGRILNPKTARSQFIGGIIMGLGMALTEETLFDERTGRIMNPSLAEYHVPVNADVPDIEAYFLDIPDPHAPLGAHGVGEIGITGVAAAVANAVFHATGKRIRDLPITLDMLL